MVEPGVVVSEPPPVVAVAEVVGASDIEVETSLDEAGEHADSTRETRTTRKKGRRTSPKGRASAV